MNTNVRKIVYMAVCGCVFCGNMADKMLQVMLFLRIIAIFVHGKCLLGGYIRINYM